MAVHAANVVELDVLGTFSCASTGVGAVSESEFVHLCYHGAYATVFLHLSLREERKLAHLADTKSMADPFLQAATHAPQPMQLAESIASSAFTLEMGRSLAS